MDSTIDSNPLNIFVVKEALFFGIEMFKVFKPLGATRWKTLKDPNLIF